MSDDIQQLWQSEDPEPWQLDMTEIKHRATELEGNIRRRNRLEISIAIATLPVWGVSFWVFQHPASRIGTCILAVGMLSIAATLYFLGRAALPTPDAPTELWLRSWQDCLSRQVTLLRAAPLWYVTPVVVGCTLLNLGIFLDMGQVHLLPAFLVIYLLMGGFISWANLQAASKLAKERDALSR